MGKMSRKSTNDLILPTIRRTNTDDLKRSSNSSLSCGNIFQLTNLNTPKTDKKKKRFSIKNFFKSSKNRKVEEKMPEPELPSLKKQFKRSFSKGKVYGNMPILRKREEIVTSGIIVWEEDFPHFLYGKSKEI